MFSRNRWRSSDQDVPPTALRRPVAVGRPGKVVCGWFPAQQYGRCRVSPEPSASPGTGGYLRGRNHGHVRGLSPLQTRMEGHRFTGAGQVNVVIHLAVAIGAFSC